MIPKRLSNKQVAARGTITAGCMLLALEKCFAQPRALIWQTWVERFTLDIAGPPDLSAVTVNNENNNIIPQHDQRHAYQMPTSGIGIPKQVIVFKVPKSLITHLTNAPSERSDEIPQNNLVLAPSALAILICQALRARYPHDEFQNKVPRLRPFYRLLAPI